MKSELSPDVQAHLDQIHAQLDALTSMFDTRVLAPAMLGCAAALYERLLSGGVLDAEDITAALRFAASIALTPTGEPVQVATSSNTTKH